ncbi:hypothetical protein [Mycobacterium sp. E2497]|uniref:8-oxoguanine DNA glycosylase OGG fold protein n=1 Tax=Mycobacterium sp. E2497 TaxID=1834135 RepID=UPI0007FC499E|nr:hypothetical protein [Mycobacterium sp. E2497]OBI24095.1 hypothetical protein A5713_08165 [Mycobacterium sp. E2497]
MNDGVPDRIRRYTVADVDAHRVRWVPERWTAAFQGHEAAHGKLAAHSEAERGIARRFIHNQADADPVDLFMIAMAWGFAPKDYGPHRVQTILATAGAKDKIRFVVAITRTEGAGAGWHALLNTHKIDGLNMSFGTKLLYFAGYTTAHRPRPLVLDKRVRDALNEPDIAPGTVPPTGLVRQPDYLRYLERAEKWASDPTWQQTPEVVEYALFAIGGR